MKPILLSLLLFTVFRCFGCDCNGYSINQGLVNFSDMIVGGKVLSVTHVDRIDAETGEKSELKKVKFLVSAFYKGSSVLDEIEVYTDSDNTCGVDFQKGKYYIVFGYFIDQMGKISGNDKQKKLFTNRCMLTQLYSKELEEKVIELNKSDAPCQVVVTSNEEVIVELTHPRVSSTHLVTIVLKKGDVCEIVGTEVNKDGSVIFHGKFKDNKDGERVKTGVIKGVDFVWGSKIDPNCQFRKVVKGISE